MAEQSVSNAGKLCKSCTEEFRWDAVRMIETEGLTTAEVGRRSEVNLKLLRKRCEKYGKNFAEQSAQSDLEAESRRPREEIRQQ